MFNSPQAILNVAIVAGVFGLVLSIWLCGMLVWTARRSKRQQTMRQRLDSPRPGAGPDRVLRLWRDGKEETTIVPGFDQVTLHEKLDRMIATAGWESSVRVIMMRLIASVLCAFILAMLITSSFFVAISTGAAVVLVFWIYLNQRIAKRGALFERQLVDALELAARSLRVGHPLVGSFRMISQEIAAPVGPVFGLVCQQQELGLGLDDAIQRAAEESRNPDMRLFATSVGIQLRAGGNLADMMERLAFVMRERLRLARRVRVLTAQTQFSKRTLLALPFLIFVVLNLVNPEYMRPLYTTPKGEMILAAGGVGLMIGAFVMNRLAVLKV